MGLIELKGLRVFAHHGVHAQEAVVGGYYRVDLQVTADLGLAETSDQLEHTLDYGRMALIIKEQMAVRGQLIEHVARRLLEALRAEWPGPYRWRLRLVKERPPVGVELAEVSYTLEA